MTVAVMNRVMEQALALPKAKQKVLLERLWEKLAPGHRLPPSVGEIERRAASVRDGTAVTLSLEEVNAALDRRRVIAMKRLQKARSTQ
jgi:putative addiction module component (TIGR02574 family)